MILIIGSWVATEKECLTKDLPKCEPSLCEMLLNVFLAHKNVVDNNASQMSTFLITEVWF